VHALEIKIWMQSIKGHANAKLMGRCIVTVLASVAGGREVGSFDFSGLEEVRWSYKFSVLLGEGRWSFGFSGLLEEGRWSFGFSGL
jgi:hypothetical protein